MRKILTVVLGLMLAASTMGPAAAVAPRPGTFKHTYVQLGYDLKFQVKSGKIRKIVGHVLENCGGGTSTTTTFAPSSTWKISKSGTFSGRHKETHAGVTVYFTFKGKFISKTRAKGILREESIVAGSTCDTYELKWTAKRR